MWLVAQLKRERGHEYSGSATKVCRVMEKSESFSKSPEARQRDIRRRTIDAIDSTTSVNPVAIEIAVDGWEYK